MQIKNDTQYHYRMGQCGKGQHHAESIIGIDAVS